MRATAGKDLSQRGPQLSALRAGNAGLLVEGCRAVGIDGEVADLVLVATGDVEDDSCLVRQPKSATVGGEAVNQGAAVPVHFGVADRVAGRAQAVNRHPVSGEQDSKEEGSDKPGAR